MEIELQQPQQTVKIPLVTDVSTHSTQGNSERGTDELFINLVPMSVQTSYPMLGHPREQFLEKREGFTTYGFNIFTGLTPAIANTSQIMDAIPITAVYNVFILAVNNTTDNKINIIWTNLSTKVAINLGEIAPPTGKTYQCFLTEISQAVAGSLLPGVAINCNTTDWTSGVGYYVPSITSSGTGALTHITDTHFPANQTPALIPVGPFVNFNGINYIASLDGQIWNSTVNGNDISNWTDSNGNIGVIAANIKPDQCVGMARYKNTVVAMGRDSIQFFEDIGNTPCPLQPIPAATITFGCAGSVWYINLNDVLYWVSFGVNNTQGVWMLDNYTPRKISTQAIDGNLQYASQNASILGKVLQGTLFKQKQNLIISGFQGQSALTLTTGFPGNSGYINSNTDTASVLANTFIPDCVCFNLVDNMWWSLNSCNAQPSPQVQAVGVIPIFLNAFDTPLGLVSGTVFVTYSPLPNFISPVADSIASGPVFTVDSLNYYDSLFKRSAPTVEIKCPIAGYAQVNAQWFGTTKRKRINRLSFSLMQPIPSETPPVNEVAGLYTYWIRDPDQYSLDFDFNPTNVNAKTVVHWTRISIPNSVYRYYINNLGTGRAWQFIFMDNSSQLMRFKFLEADVSLASS